MTAYRVFRYERDTEWIPGAAIYLERSEADKSAQRSNKIGVPAVVVVVSLPDPPKKATA